MGKWKLLARAGVVGGFGIRKPLRCHFRARDT
jgi:hypothetical protein